MADEDKHKRIPTRYGDLNIPAKNYEPILGDLIGRVNGPRDWMSKSGHYIRPLLCFHVKHGVYHRYPDLQSLLRALRTSKDWEGAESPELDHSEHQRLLSWLAAHENLRGWAVDGFASVAEQQRFERICTELSVSMGRPVDEVKRLMQEFTLQAALSEGPEAVDLLQQATGLGKRRLGAVKNIAKKVNVRALVVLKEITEQHRALKACHDALPGLLELHNTHAKNPQNWRERNPLFEGVIEAGRALEWVKDRPFRGLASRTKTDLSLYIEQAAENGYFMSADVHLRRAIVGQTCADVSWRANAALYLLALALRRGNARSDELRSKAQGMIHEIARVNPAEGDILHNNPLWRVVGCANDALVILRSQYPNWSEVKDLLHETVATT